ncbi:MAG: hypothetical protein R6W70_06300, partial [bacterium]
MIKFFMIVFLLSMLGNGTIYSQELDIIFDSSVGSGIQAGMGAERTEWNMAAVFTDLEIMINTDNDPFFEYGVSFFVPLTKRMALAVIPKGKLKKNLPGNFQMYVTGGVAVFVAGVNLYGIHLEPGIRSRINDFVDFFTEMNFGIYPLGKDIPELTDS